MRTSISLDEAQARILGQVEPLADPEQVNAVNCVGRVAYRDVYAAVDQPPFNRSPLDGYTFSHRDTQGATSTAPVMLRVTQHIYAGDTDVRPLGPGEAARIMTGGMIPTGADCVIRQEDTDGGEERVGIGRAMQAFENYCFVGEDLKKGDKLISRGDCLGYAHAGVLAGQGIDALEVFRPPVVGLITTGDELVPAGAPLPPGKIYNSNLGLLSARLFAMGAVALTPPSVGDTPEAIAHAVAELLERCDLVVTTGGVSVGERDYLPAVVDRLGAQLLFHGLTMKPGSPALAMVKNGRMAICLSGNPFAAMATFEVLARPAIEKLRGNRDFMPVRAKGIARGDFGKASPTQRLVRARMVGQDIFIPEGGHASGMLGSLAGCNCLVDIPAGSPPIHSGMTVEVILI